MYKYFLTIILFTYSAYGHNYIDLGIKGNLYKIIEENGNDMLQKAIKDINSTKITNSLKNEVFNAFKSNISFKDSNKNEVTKKEDYVKARWDIKDPYGNIVVKKGELILSKIPKGTSFDLCFINGDENKLVLDYIVNKFSNCIYMVNKISSIKFMEMYPYKAYPLTLQNLEFVSRFDIKSVPVKITKSGRYLKKNFLNIFEIRKKILEKK